MDDININHVNGEPNITYTHGNVVYDDANNIKTKILKIAHNGKLYNNITNVILGIRECNNVIVSIKAPTYRTWEDIINDEFVLISDGSSTTFIPPLPKSMNALIYNIEIYVKNMDNKYYKYLHMFKYYIINHDRHQVGNLPDMMITGNLKFTNEYVDGYTNSIEIFKKVKDLYV